MYVLDTIIVVRALISHGTTSRRRIFMESRKRVVAIVAGIIVARHLDTADDLFGGPQGSPRTDKMVAAAIQWAERILQKIDSGWG
jgi:hypothetical protein